MLNTTVSNQTARSSTAGSEGSEKKVAENKGRSSQAGEAKDERNIAISEATKKVGGARPTASPNRGRPQASQELEAVESFDDMGLTEGLLRGIYGYGYESPSAIQQKAVVPMTKGRDMIGQAEAGSGKTAAFLIGMLNNINTRVRHPQALILAPVRELATQIYDVCCALSQYQGVDDGDPLIPLCLIGGASVRTDIRKLCEGVHVAIGTPGRLKHMIEAGYLQCGGLKTIVLDEADELLSRGFQESIYEIFQVLPADIQACLFSATMPPEIIALSSKFLREPVSIRVANEDLNRLDCVQQFYVDTGEERWKLDTLLDIYAALDINQSMIFVNTKQKCDRLYADLEERDFTCQVIHGGMSQQDRNLAMLAFKSGSARILLSTGLLKRGIDIQAVNLVLNYDLPNSMEVYIHAVNRVGRYGRKGVALNFLAGQRDIQMLQDIERHYNTEIKEMPDPKEIARYM